jgi:hypothetical protein
MIIYQSIVHYGSYDEATDETIYVGTDYNLAVKMLKDYDFNNLDNVYRQIDYWLDGKYIRSEEV